MSNDPLPNISSGDSAANGTYGAGHNSADSTELQKLAGKIRKALADADQLREVARNFYKEGRRYLGDSEAQRVIAGRLLWQARRLFEATKGQGDTWKGWCAKNVPGRSRADIKRLLVIGRADDPARAHAEERAAGAGDKRQRRAAQTITLSEPPHVRDDGTDDYGTTRSLCQNCGSAAKLTATGTIRPHHQPGGRIGSHCPGAGKPPRWQEGYEPQETAKPAVAAPNVVFLDRAAQPTTAAQKESDNPIQDESPQSESEEGLYFWEWWFYYEGEEQHDYTRSEDTARAALIAAVRETVKDSDELTCFDPDVLTEILDRGDWYVLSDDYVDDEVSWERARAALGEPDIGPYPDAAEDDNAANEPDGESIPKPHYWVTPPDMLAAIVAEFGPVYDPCPHPRPEGYDGISAEWEGPTSYVNPPFTKGFVAWVRKSLIERDNGKTCILVVPMAYQGTIVMLDEAGAEIRYLGVPSWLSLEDGTPNPAPMASRQPCVLCILRPTKPIYYWFMPWTREKTDPMYPPIKSDIDVSRLCRQLTREHRYKLDAAIELIKANPRPADNFLEEAAD